MGFISIVYLNPDLKLLTTNLKAFPALERLDLGTDTLLDEDLMDDHTRLMFNPVDLTKFFSFEIFKDLSNITQLTLHLYSNSDKSVKESILTDIDINLPKLQYLEIKNKFDTTSKGVKQMAETLSRLSSLETLKLKFKPGVNYKPIEELIPEKCRKEFKSGYNSDTDSDKYHYFDSDGDYGYGNRYAHNYDFDDDNSDSDSEYD